MKKKVAKKLSSLAKAPSSDYLSIRYSEKIDPQITNCYLCDKPLDTEITPDHIIPDHLFNKNDPHRPKLYVHHGCNNQKSKKDQWFIKQIQLRSYFDPRAERDFSKMMDKAKKEKSDAYIIGKKIPSYKLARGIFDKVVWGMEFKHGNQSFLQLKISHPNAVRFQQYVEIMCQGLFIRNVPSSKPPKPDLIMKQYANLELRDKVGGFMNTIKTLVKDAEGSKFGQRWGDRVSYIGSRVAETPNKGFLFVQFYSQFGIFATFR